MSSGVTLRRPKSVGSGATPRGNIGRPKSWTEFNTRFQTLSNPVNIDLSPSPTSASSSDVTKRPPNTYRKVRPLSASFLDLPHDDTTSSHSPSSPNYTSLLTPYPWRNNSQKASPVSNDENGQLKYDYDSTNYDVTKNAIKWKTVEENTPEANAEHENSESSDPELKQIAFSSDSDSIDSAVVVSGECTPYATSSEKSPRWRQTERGTADNLKSIAARNSQKSPSFESVPLRHNTSNDIHIENESRSASENSDTSSSLSFHQPEIVISGQKKIAGMEFFPDEDVIHFEESPVARFDRRNIVPSPLKSCYSPVATYDDLVEYSDFENSSAEENSAPELSRHNNVALHGRDGNRPINDVISDSTLFEHAQSQKLRVYNFPDDVTNDNAKKNRDVTKKSSAKRRSAPEKKTEEEIDFDEIMNKFKKSKEEHLESLKWIYADSSKKVHDLLAKLKETMTENGYLEWYPRVRQ